MKVTIDYNLSIITVESEPGDPRFSGVKHAKGEHRLFYHIKNILNQRGFDLIKKRIQKDGHMMGDEYQPYIRTRKPTGDSKKDIYIYNPMYAVRGADEILKEDGVVRLRLITDIFSDK